MFDFFDVFVKNLFHHQYIPSLNGVISRIRVHIERKVNEKEEEIETL